MLVIYLIMPIILPRLYRVLLYLPFNITKKNKLNKCNINYLQSSIILLDSATGSTSEILIFLTQGFLYFLGVSGIVSNTLSRTTPVIFSITYDYQSKSFYFFAALAKFILITNSYFCSSDIFFIGIVFYKRSKK